MPTVVQERGYRVMIFFNDHPPPHAHVFKDGQKARVYLSPVALWDSTLKANETKQAIKIVEANRDTLLNKWHEIHGDNDGSEEN